MAHIVTAPLIIAKNGDGSDRYLYRGSDVPADQSSEWVATHLATGMIAEVEGAPDADAESPSDPIEAFLNRSADAVINDIPTLTAEDRAAVAAAEENGKNRVTVMRALADAESPSDPVE